MTTWSRFRNFTLRTLALCLTDGLLPFHSVQLDAAQLLLPVPEQTEARQPEAQSGIGGIGRRHL